MATRKRQSASCASPTKKRRSDDKEDNIPEKLVNKSIDQELQKLVKNTTVDCHSNPDQTGTLNFSYEQEKFSVTHSSGLDHLKITHKVEEQEKFAMWYSLQPTVTESPLVEAENLNNTDKKSKLIVQLDATTKENYYCCLEIRHRNDDVIGDLSHELPKDLPEPGSSKPNNFELKTDKKRGKHTVQLGFTYNFAEAMTDKKRGKHTVQLGFTYNFAEAMTAGYLKVLVNGEFAYCYLNTSNCRVGYKYDISESNSHKWTIEGFPGPSTIKSNENDKCLAVRGSAEPYYVEGVRGSGDTFSFSNQGGYYAISTTIKNQHKDEETFYLGPSSDGEKIIATKTDTPSYVFQFPGN